jgi:hypothetical protein
MGQNTRTGEMGLLSGFLRGVELGGSEGPDFRSATLASGDRRGNTET